MSTPYEVYRLGKLVSSHPSRKAAYREGMALRRAGHDGVYIFPKDSPFKPREEPVNG